MKKHMFQEDAMAEEKKAKMRGISPEKQREISSMGGKAAHAQGRAHEFTSEEARAAGRKGGVKVSSDREHMARIGRIGGAANAAKAKKRDVA
jgi:uncharacterized protein